MLKNVTFQQSTPRFSSSQNLAQWTAFFYLLNTISNGDLPRGAAKKFNLKVNSIQMSKIKHLILY